MKSVYDKDLAKRYMFAKELFEKEPSLLENSYMCQMTLGLMKFYLKDTNLDEATKINAQEVILNNLIQEQKFYNSVTKFNKSRTESNKDPISIHELNIVRISNHQGNPVIKNLKAAYVIEEFQKSPVNQQEQIEEFQKSPVNQQEQQEQKEIVDLIPNTKPEDYVRRGLVFLSKENPLSETQLENLKFLFLELPNIANTLEPILNASILHALELGEHVTTSQNASHAESIHAEAIKAASQQNNTFENQALEYVLHAFNKHINSNGIKNAHDIKNETHANSTIEDKSANALLIKILTKTDISKDKMKDYLGEFFLKQISIIAPKLSEKEINKQYTILKQCTEYLFSSKKKLKDQNLLELENSMIALSKNMNNDSALSNKSTLNKKSNTEVLVELGCMARELKKFKVSANSKHSLNMLFGETELGKKIIVDIVFKAFHFKINDQSLNQSDIKKFNLNESDESKIFQSAESKIFQSAESKIAQSDKESHSFNALHQKPFSTPAMPPIYLQEAERIKDVSIEKLLFEKNKEEQCRILKYIMQKIEEVQLNIAKETSQSIEAENKITISIYKRAIEFVQNVFKMLFGLDPKQKNQDIIHYDQPSFIERFCHKESLIHKSGRNSGRAIS